MSDIDNHQEEGHTPDQDQLDNDNPPEMD